MPVRIERKSGAGKKVTFVYSTSEIDRMVGNLPEKLTLESQLFREEEVQNENTNTIDELDDKLTELNEDNLPGLDQALEYLHEALDQLNNTELPLLKDHRDQLDEE